MKPKIRAVRKVLKASAPQPIESLPLAAPTAPQTMSVPDAGRKYFGLSRPSSYEAAARGDIPVIRVGRLLRVPIRAMERLMDLAGAAEAR